MVSEANIRGERGTLLLYYYDCILHSTNLTGGYHR